MLRDRGDQESLALLSSLPANTSRPRSHALAQEGVASIQNRLALWEVLQNAWYGLSLGSVLLLAAIGLAITFGVMGVINMAHGEMVMIGAYVTFVVQDLIRVHNPALFDYSLAFAIPLAFLLAGAIGILIERTVIQWLYGRPLDTLARDLGHLADPAAGGPHHVRSDQSRGRQPVLDERRLRTRSAHHHL